MSTRRTVSSISPIAARRRSCCSASGPAAPGQATTSSPTAPPDVSVSTWRSPESDDSPDSSRRTSAASLIAGRWLADAETTWSIVVARASSSARLARESAWRMAAVVPSTRCTVPATSAPSIARRPSSPGVKACGSSHTMPTTPNDAPLVVTRGTAAAERTCRLLASASRSGWARWYSQTSTTVTMRDDRMASVVGQWVSRGTSPAPPAVRRRAPSTNATVTSSAPVITGSASVSSATTSSRVPAAVRSRPRSARWSARVRSSSRRAASWEAARSERRRRLIAKARATEARTAPMATASAGQTLTGVASSARISIVRPPRSKPRTMPAVRRAGDDLAAVEHGHVRRRVDGGPRRLQHVVDRERARDEADHLTIWTAQGRGREVAGAAGADELQWWAQAGDAGCIGGADRLPTDRIAEDVEAVGGCDVLGRLHRDDGRVARSLRRADEPAVGPDVADGVPPLGLEGRPVGVVDDDRDGDRTQVGVALHLAPERGQLGRADRAVVGHHRAGPAQALDRRARRLGQCRGDLVGGLQVALAGLAGFTGPDRAGREEAERARHERHDEHDPPCVAPSQPRRHLAWSGLRSLRRRAPVTGAE